MPDTILIHYPNPNPNPVAVMTHKYSHFPLECWENKGLEPHSFPMRKVKQRVRGILSIRSHTDVQ